MNSNLNVVAVNDNITIYHSGESFIINRIKNKDTYDKVLEKVKANDVAWIEKNVKNIKDEIESKTDGVFSIEKGKVILKGTDIPVPEVILKKLVEMEQEKQPILPLLKFWRKLSSNPSENSRNELYTFMIKNNIPITEEGDIVTEKGVSQKLGSFFGDLVDDRTKKIDNSIGSYVVLPREAVDADSNKTCSFGLHVAAPDYVRRVYSSSILVECIVNPKDVVSIPTDYNSTKMRVCAYRVAGYSRKEPRKSFTVVKLSDFFNTPIPEEQVKIGGEVKKTKKLAEVKEDVFNLKDLTGKELIELVKEKTGELITISLKSKKSILKKAEQLLEVYNIKG